MSENKDKMSKFFKMFVTMPSLSIFNTPFFPVTLFKHNSVMVKILSTFGLIFQIMHTFAITMNTGEIASAIEAL